MNQLFPVATAQRPASITAGGERATYRLIENEEVLAIIRNRIRRSLDDPRADLDEDEVDRHFANLHVETMKAHIDDRTYTSSC